MGVMELTSTDVRVKFSQAFEYLTSYQPYPWQVRLFESFLGGQIPQSLSLPTGTGKTNSILCWLLALAFSKVKLPRRLVYVVDRRSVVDQSTKVVEEMYAKLTAPTLELDLSHSLHEIVSYLHGLMVPVIEQMSENEDKDRALLGVSTLRGEYADNHEWSRFPFRPSVTVGTVDMIGSRLLFSGYGDGAYSKSLHAGLLGNDTLVIFDECHLVPAFGLLLQNVEKAGGKLKPFHMMLMSATGDGDSEITLDDYDLVNETISKRLKAKKTLRLVGVAHPVKHIPTIALNNPPARTIVFVQSPGSVREIASRLRKIYKNVVTLTGTMRGKERDELLQNPTFQGFMTEEGPEEPHFLIATSAGEVGIDLTCARMITDITAAQSLIQRFGRNVRFAESDGEIFLVFNEAKLFGHEKDLEFIKTLNGDVSCWNLWNHREELSKLARSSGCKKARLESQSAPVSVPNR